MKVAIFYPYATGEKAFSGGVPKVIVSNIIAVKQNGDEPYLILPTNNNGLIAYVKEHHPYCHIVTVDIMALLRYTDVKNIFKRACLVTRSLYKFLCGKKKLSRALNEISPDVIHYHEIVCYNLLNCYTKCRIVFHIHSYRFTSYQLLTGIIYKQINKYANVVISPTESIRKAVENELKNVVIVKTPYLEMGSSGVDETQQAHFRQMKEDGKIILSFVGRICPVKRIDNCIKALSRIPKNDLNNIKYVIIGGCNNAGDYDYKKELEGQIKQYQLEENVEFVGYVNPVETVLPYIDYGVMLTESEAMPMVGIEYMKYNIPTVGYDAPGINDYLIDEVNGFIVRDGDISHLTEVLLRIIKKEQIPNFTKTIPETFNGYSVDMFASELKKIYR